MADSKISGLTSATTPLAGTEVLPIVQGGQTRQVSVANLTAGRSVDASTLTVTGNTYLATTSGNVGVGATSVTAIYGKTLQIGSGSTESSLSLLGSTGNGFVATTGATFGVFGRGGMALVLGTNDVERARIDTSGNVGIGTSSPAAKLDVVGSLGIRVNEDAAGTKVIQIRSNYAGLGPSIQVSTADPLLFLTSNTERMRITSTGTVGIGTSSPAGTLHVYGSGTTQAVLTSGDQTTTYLRFINTTNNAGYVGYTSDNLIFLTGSSERMRLDASGNLGLGVTPSAWISAYRALDIGNTASVYGRTDSSIEAALVANAYRNSSGNWIYRLTDVAGRFGYDTVGSWAWYTAPSGTAGNAISFTQAMTLDASGQLGVGVTGPLNTVQIHSASNTAIRVSTGGAVTQFRGYVIGNNSSDTAEYGSLKMELLGGELRLTAGFATWGGFQTFYTNGSERMRIDSSGNVGIGTSSPGAKLEVSSTGTSISRFIGTQGGTLSTYFQNPAIFANSQAYTLDFEYTDGTNIYTAARIKTFRTGGSKETYLSFETTPNAGVVTERMRITAAGDVGIGTSSPGYKFDVSGTGRFTGAVEIRSGANAYNTLADTTTTATSGYYAAYNASGTRQGYMGYWDASGYSIAAESGNALLLWTGGSERMRITSAGDVGIGTSSPVGKLGVAGSQTVGFNAGATGSPEAGNLFYTTDGTGWQFRIGKYQSGAFTSQMVFTDAGNVGIGTSSPDAKLRVNGTTKVGEGVASNTSKLMVNTVSGVAAGIQLFQDANESWIIQNPANTTALTFGNSGTERMRITSAGDVGIGTSSPSYKLQVGALGGGVQSGIWVPGSFNFDGAYLQQATSTGRGSALTLAAHVDISNSTAYRISADNDSASRALVFSYAADASSYNALSFTERMRITSAGDVGIGTSSPVGRLTIQGAAGTNGINQGIGLLYSNGTQFGALGLNNTTGWPQLMARAGAGITFHVNSDLLTTGEAMRLDTTGNLGLGVTPSAYESSGGVIYATGITSAGANGATIFGNNTNFSGGTKYLSNGLASQYYQLNGEHVWRTAPSGTAGNAISFNQPMTLDASGNLLVGTTANTESAKLNVQGGYIFLKETNGGDVYLRSGFGAGTDPAIQVASNDPLLFVTNNNERMRITSAGDVGIGTSSPNAKLEANAAVTFVDIDTFGQFVVKATAGTTGYLLNFGVDTASGLSFIQSVNRGTNVAPLTLQRYGGNVGIGTASPAYSLDVYKAGAASISAARSDTQAVLRAEVGACAADLIALSTYGEVRTATNHPLLFSTNATERMRITAAGDVGIGTSSPAAKLDVRTGTTGNVATFFGTSSIHLAVEEVGGVMFLDANNGSATLGIKTNDTERMRIDSSGNVGVGTTSPASRLDVQTTAGRFQVQAYGAGSVLLNSNGVLAYNAANTRHEWQIANSTLMQLDSAGNLGLGVTPSASWPSATTVFQFGPSSALYNPGSNSRAILASNAIFTSGVSSATYITSNAAAYYDQNNGTHVWHIAPSGTAGNAISFTQAMTLDASGNLGVGTAVGTARIISAVADGTYSFAAVGTTKAIRITHSSISSKIEGVDSTLSASYQPLALNGSYLAFETGTTERMRIDSSGNVGIGTSSPTSKLTIDVTGAAPTTVTALTLRNTLDGGVGINFTNSVSLPLASINALVTSSGAGTDDGILQFSTAVNGVNTERMRIDSAGNVGIGTNNPLNELTIVKSKPAFPVVLTVANSSGAAYSQSQISATCTSSTSGTVNAFMLAGSNDEARFGSTGGAFPVTFHTNGSERMRITSAGDVGIGTSSPSYKLDIYGTAGVGLQLYETSSGTDKRLRITQEATAVVYNATYGTVGNAHVWQVGNSEAMRITSAGTVGIGTSSPAGTLHVYGSGTTQAVLTSGDQTTTYLRFINTTNNAGYVGYTSDNLIFLTGSSERMRITSAGNIHTPAGATTMTNGFIYIPSAGGAPTGAATAITGTVPLYYDTTNNKLFVYNSSWQNVATAGSLPLVATNANGVVYLNGSSQATTSTALQFNGTELAVGITPSAGIQLEAYATSLAQVRARTATSGVDSRLASAATGLLGYVGTISNHDFAVYTNNTERARVTATGALQLSPTGGEGGELNLLNPTGGTVGGYVDVSVANNFRLWTGNLNATMQIGQLSSTGGNIQFFTEASEKMRLTSAGVLGIGTSSPGGSGVHVSKNTAGAHFYASGSVSGANVSYLVSNTNAAANSHTGYSFWNDTTSTSPASINFYSSSVMGAHLPNELRIYNHSGSIVFRTGSSATQKFRVNVSGEALVVNASGLGYGTGAGDSVTQTTSRTTGVTCNNPCGAITLVSAAGTTVWTSFTVTNSVVDATDTVIVNQKSGTNLYEIHITAVSAGSFRISFRTTGDTTTEQPVFNFAVIKAVIT